MVRGAFVAKHPSHHVHQPMCLVVGPRNKAAVNIDRHGVAEQPFPNPDVRPEIVVIGNRLGGCPGSLRAKEKVTSMPEEPVVGCPFPIGPANMAQHNMVAQPHAGIDNRVHTDGQNAFVRYARFSSVRTAH